MTIRREVKAWLAQRGIPVADVLYTSKLYAPSSSWTGAHAWWIQVPLERIETAEVVGMALEGEEGAAPFRYLEVPTAFLRENLSSFGMLGERSINLFLSAEPEDLLVDRRGLGRVNFSSFELHPPP